MSHLFTLAAIVVPPAAVILHWNRATYYENLREIRFEYSSGIGSKRYEDGRLQEFEERETQRQHAWARRPWSRLFASPPDVDWEGCYYDRKRD
jgi:hypothetical protein